MRDSLRPVAGIVSVFLLALQISALAHRMDLYVYVDGAVIYGETRYVPSGAPNAGHVRLRTPDGALLAEFPLESDGSFQYQTPVRGDLNIQVDTPDAHRATFVLSEAELPEALPRWDDDAKAVDTVEGIGISDVAASDQSGTLEASLPEHASQDLLSTLEQSIDRAVMRQSAVLRNEIARIEHRIRFRDILGGIGYIAGIVGLLAYLKFKPASQGR